ncbi:hypothetical protein PoB_000630900 [Plakobranchus ocellatus]|uniref:Uncharacterized protein n=1 Tax=Plakobranchus ocellatus TaxID=259542 RepID=A0AAV3YC18_9GAST|nr:hypothetical protein PoB_000630900 [Plakobranchus ocellatus]
MGLGVFVYIAVHNKVISGFKALRQAGAPTAGLEPTTEGSMQISGRIHKPLCHRRPVEKIWNSRSFSIGVRYPQYLALNSKKSSRRIEIISS